MEEEEEIDPCEIPPVTDYRFYMIVVFGTSLSLISIISNFLIAIVLLRRRHSNFFFLGLLAVSDTFVSFCYFPVIAMETARYRFPVSFSSPYLLNSLFIDLASTALVGLCRSTIGAL
jgi:hypothetical protein